MRKAKRLPALSLLAVAALFVYGLTHLLALRFEKGDAYPRYSSYRPDPVGTKAFYEALRLLPGVETTRNVEPLQKASGLSEATLFLFGFRASRFNAMPHAEAKAIEEAALGGGRVVISFFPACAQPAADSENTGKKARGLEEDSEQQNEEDREEEQGLNREEYVDLSGRWSVSTELSNEKSAEASVSESEKDLPASLPWHSTLYFEPQDDAWRALYTRAGKPVLIERSYGKGNIVLSSDSFFLSNGAMKNKRNSRILSWLCGTRRKIVFDETHLGVSKSSGIAALLRKYGLAPFFASLIGLALLTVWKQSARLVPSDSEEEKGSVDPGKDAITGFTNLLRRNISAGRLLYTCLEEWEHSFTHGRQNLSALLPRIQEIIAEDGAKPKRKRSAVQAYREISRLGRRR